MTFTFDIAGISWQGKRDYQEDHFRICAASSNHVSAIVADGMGGQKGGAAAGAIVVEAFEEYVSAKECDASAMRHALQSAVAQMQAMVTENPDLHQMGATALAVSLWENRLIWLSVGDSVLLHIRAGQVRRLNADHSCAPILDERARRGEISEEEALNDPTRHALRSSVKATAPRLVEIREKEGFLQPEDRLCLASDGLQVLHYDEIAAIASPLSCAKTTANTLCDAVKTKNLEAQDNTTIVVITFS